MTTEEKLKHFEESSMEKAREQSLQMIKDHQEALAKIEAEHMADKDRQAALQLKIEADNIKRGNNMALSKEQLQIKRRLTKVHDELKEELFAGVQTKLEDFMDTPAYEQLLIKQIKDIQKTADGHEVIIYIDPADVAKLPSLSVATNASLTLSEYSFHGGTRAVLPARQILIDNSFATKIAEAREDFKFDGGNSYD